MADEIESLTDGCQGRRRCPHFLWYQPLDTQNMLSRVIGRYTLVLALIFASSLLTPVLAQTQIKLPPQSSVAIDNLFKRGQELETQQRWGEALTFYETAHKSHPDQVAFE